MKAMWLACILLAGCMPEPPQVYVEPVMPEIPAECSAVCPAEPRLPDQDITAAAAARDRSAMKQALRCERQTRATCAARLKVLLPKT